MKIKNTIGPVTMPGGVTIEAIINEVELDTAEEFGMYVAHQKEMIESIKELIGTDIADAVKKVVDTINSYNEQAFNSIKLCPDEQEEIEISVCETENTVRLPRGFSLREITDESSCL